VAHDGGDFNEGRRRVGPSVGRQPDLPSKIEVQTGGSPLVTARQDIRTDRCSLFQLLGADTHYSEVREIVLPSGLSTFSTLQAMMPTHRGKSVRTIQNIDSTAALRVVTMYSSSFLDGVEECSIISRYIYIIVLCCRCRRRRLDPLSRSLATLGATRSSVD